MDSTRDADDIQSSAPLIKRAVSRNLNRNNKHSYLKIREITPEDSKCVCKLLFDHFRSFTFPAIIYWVVQHVHDIAVIVLINAFLLTVKNLIYFCLLFLIYLYIRARYEIEHHIRYCCPDLVDVYDTYRTSKGSNFWVGFCSDNEEEWTGRTASNEEGSDDPHHLQSQQSESEARLLRESSRVTNEDVPRAQHNEILGCIGITPYRNKTDVAQMVRLVVSPKCRNMRVGSRLLKHFELYALDLGYNEIRVFTNNLNTAYLHFLKQNNFEIMQIVRRGLMRGDLIIWNKVLRQSPDKAPVAPADTAIVQPSKVTDASFIPE